MNRAVKQKFIPEVARRIIISATTAEELLDKMQAFVPEPDPAMIQIDWTRQSFPTSSLP